MLSACRQVSQEADYAIRRQHFKIHIVLVLNATNLVIGLIYKFMTFLKSFLSYAFSGQCLIFSFFVSYLYLFFSSYLSSGLLPPKLCIIKSSQSSELVLHLQVYLRLHGTHSIHQVCIFKNGIQSSRCEQCTEMDRIMQNIVQISIEVLI